MEDFTPPQINDLVARYFPDHLFCQIRACSFCGTPIGYYWYREQVTLVTSCECTTYHSEPRLSSWLEVIATFEDLPITIVKPEPEAQWP